MSADSVHVALVTPWDTGGGIANYSKRLRDALQEEGVSVTIVPIENPETGNILKFNKLIQSIPTDVDVVHVQYEAGVFGKLGLSGVCTPTFFAHLAQKDWPIITTLHEVHREYPGHSTAAATIVGARDWIVEEIALAASNTTIVHTAEAKNVLRNRHRNFSKIEELRHPVDDRTSPPINKDVARAEFDIKAESVFVTFGWVEKKKRYRDVIRCLPDLPNANYLIAGEPRHEDDKKVLENVFSLAEDLGVRNQVQYLGYIADENLPRLFSAADVTVAPYKQVTQSGAVNTALAYYCPVVTTGLPAFEELATEYDCVLTYENRSELYDILSNLNENTPERLQRSAKRYANTETWSSFAKETRMLYENEIFVS